MKVTKANLIGAISAGVVVIFSSQATAEIGKGSIPEHAYGSVGYVSMIGSKGAIRNDDLTHGYEATGYGSMDNTADAMAADIMHLQGDANLLHGYGATGYNPLPGTLISTTEMNQDIQYGDPMGGYEATSYSQEFIN